ncbi:hypothetical protein D043_2882A, partial [Vibrio parahaemolyticus EKP-021]
MVLLYTLD